MKEILLGVKILSCPAPMIKTKAVYICPRFVITNATDREIYARQIIKNKPGSVVTSITEDNLLYNLEDSYESKTIQISTNKKFWSDGFDVDEISEFQICLDSLNSERIQSGPWYLPSPTNDYKTYILVTISTEDQCTISINFKNPALPEFLIGNYTNFPLTVSRDNYSCVIPPQIEIPWAGSDKVTVRKDKSEVSYSLIKLDKKAKNIPGITAKVEIKGVTRVLQLGEKENSENAKNEKLKSEIVATLAGFGVSLYSESAEIVFLSVFQIFTRIRNRVFSDGKVQLKLDASIRKVQLDNMDKEENQFGVIYSGNCQEAVPFFQTKIQKISNEDYNKFTWFEVTFQEMKVQLNQEIIYKVLDFITKLKSEFIKDTKTEYKSCRSIEEAFPELSPVFVVDKEKLKSSIKIYAAYLRLYALKITLSFRVAPKKYELKFDPRNAFGLGQIASGVASSFVNITDSELKFTEILVTVSFQTPEKMLKTILQNYTQQGIIQFYKLLGSSDMIGNPVRLVGKLGTGVYEFVAEPLKGILAGPKAFKEGVGKGVKSLMSNVVGGGLQSFGNITGSLYNAVNKVKGEKQKDLEGEKLGGSLMGGIKDIGKGFTGIFSKPWSGLRNEGGTGLVKGIGSGLMGAVTAPISAGLRISSGLTKEVSSAVSEKKLELQRVREPKTLSPK